MGLLTVLVTFGFPVLVCKSLVTVVTVLVTVRFRVVTLVTVTLKKCTL